MRSTSAIERRCLTEPTKQRQCLRVRETDDANLDSVTRLEMRMRSERGFSAGWNMGGLIALLGRGRTEQCRGEMRGKIRRSGQEGVDRRESERLYCQDK